MLFILDHVLTTVPTVPKTGTIAAFRGVFATTVPLLGTIGALDL